MILYAVFGPFVIKGFVRGVTAGVSVGVMFIVPVLVLLLLHHDELTLAAQLPGHSGSKPPSFAPLATNGQPFPWDRMRLPETVSPLHYHLLIHPNLTTLDFSGSVLIELEVHTNTHSIILHSKDLQISSAVLLAAEGSRPLQVLEYPAFQQLALLSDTVLTRRGRYEVYLEFSANLSDSFHGFYKSTYRTSEGEVRYIFFLLYGCSFNTELY